MITIGEFARRSQLSLKALRLYDRLGLLRPAVVDPSNRYRRYDETQLYTARLIAMLRQLDMPLSTVAAVVAAGDRGADVLAAYWSEIERRHDQRRRLSEFLRSSLADGTGHFGGFRILERDVPDQHVLTSQRSVLVSELDDFVWATIEELRTTARVVGSVFVIFHGPVGAEQAGLVEVCVPVEPELTNRSELTSRCEPAHHEAYIRLTKAEFGYPQIMSAYDALEHWGASYPLECAGSPREVHLCADPRVADPADEVCDLALPLTLPMGQAAPSLP